VAYLYVNSGVVRKVGVVWMEQAGAEDKKRRGGNFVCPRCGGLGYLERRSVGGHVYVYCRHVWREGGRRRERKCYLGAEEYDYVERFQLLGLAGLTDKERFRRYMRSLLERLSPEDLTWIMEQASIRLKNIKPQQT
jgi:hypothetical protein